MPNSSIICCPFILVLLFFIATTPSIYSNNQSDYEALLAFKKAIHDDPLRALSSWNETTHFCRWYGVSCSKRHPNRVVSVFLQHQCLVGSLSPHIGNLSFLISIDLQNNTFHGQIPEEIGRLRRLQVIVFSNNSFGGGIPRNLSQCRNLYWLNLIDNQLTGSIVPEMASLLNLSVLGLSVNMLSGTIPPSLGNLTSLTRLSLAECGLSGEIPESMAQLRRVWFLSLMQNNLSGRIPSALYNLSDIETLALGSNLFIGTIPSHIAFTLPKLRILDLAENHFTGPLPASLSNSSQIIVIAAGVNNFIGEMIQVNRLSALQHLGVGDNHLKGDINTITTSLTNCTVIQTITLSGNIFRGSLPDSVGNLSSHLWYLNVGENQLRGSIPSSIGNLLGLALLSFAYNDLQGRISSSIGKLHKLQGIYFHANKLTNEIPSSFGNLTLLNHLVLYQNDLSGNVPPSLGNCSNLLWLELSENNLNGSIPPEIMRLSSISISLNLSYNVLMGNIPSEVGDLRNLGELDLSHNRLSGFIPNSLSSCVMLEWLLLQSNSIQGEIPESMSSLRGLKYLDLSQNNISGTIPRFLAELHLEFLNISFNALHGEVPAIGVFQNESAVSLEGNPEVCGGIATLNLPSCSPTNSNRKDFRKILIPIAGAAVCLVLLACFSVIMYRLRTSQNAETPTTTFRVSEFLRLSYGDLLNATVGFSEANLVGAGRFGSVYRGSIVINDDEQTDVAVKVLNLNERGASRSLESECNALRGIRHRNLLKILSVCESIDFRGDDFKALVYEFMAYGRLENWLHQNSNEEVRILSTIQRINIAIDIACGVEYLHCSTNSSIVHGDLKPSNILLDHDVVAHVGDFGLAKIISSISGNLSSSDGSSSAAIKGTIGYIAPEYGMNNVVSTHGDAYSYGILVLEMSTNRRPTNDALEHTNLHDFLLDSVMEVVDPLLHQKLNRNDKYRACIVSILSIGVRCSEQLPRNRMSMVEVVLELKRVRNLFLAANDRARH